MRWGVWLLAEVKKDGKQGGNIENNSPAGGGGKSGNNPSAFVSDGGGFMSGISSFFSSLAFADGGLNLALGFHPLGV